MRPTVVGAVLLACMVSAPAPTALAHGGNGGSTSDYRIEVTGYEGNRMELVRSAAKEVDILGYDDEPYIRMAADGEFENTNSPSYYANLDRFGRQKAPAPASGTAAPAFGAAVVGSELVAALGATERPAAPERAATPT